MEMISKGRMDKIDILSAELDAWLQEHIDLIREVKEPTDVSVKLCLPRSSALALDFLWGRLLLASIGEHTPPFDKADNANSNCQTS